MKDNERWISCQFCSYQSTTIHQMNKHLLEEHRDKLDTDADENGSGWSYIKMKEEEK